MRPVFRKPVVVFFIAMLVLSAIFFLIPINLFDGVYTLENHQVVETQMSLSYFIGIGSSPEEMQGVIDFKLLPMGYFMVFLFLVALPGLIAYRVHLGNVRG